MAERKPLFIDSEGYPEEFQTSDTATFGGLTLGGDITMEGNKITGLGPGTSPGDALTYDQAGATLSGLTLANSVDMGNNNITNMADGVNAQDAVTKNQLDNAVSGLDWQEPVHVIEVIDDTLTAPPASPAEGDSYIVATGGTGAWNGLDDHFVTWDGSSWDDVHTAASGHRFIVKETGLGGNMSGHENDIGVVLAVGSSYSWIDPEDGWAAIIHQHSPQAYWDSLGFVFDEDTPDWIQFTGAGQIVAGDGLLKSANTIYVNPGLGIDINADKVEVQLSDNDDAGLEFNVTSGLKVKIDDTPDTLDVDADGLKVVGVPSGMKIAGTQVGPNFNAANIDTLTDGSDAVGLHNHDSEYSASGHTHTHASTTGQTANDHHNELHSIDSHNDTTATGAELDELTNGSQTTLHSHEGSDEAKELEFDFNADTNVALGDPVRPTSSNGVSPSNHALGSCRRTIGIATTAQTTGNDVPVAMGGYINGVLSGATIGAIIYIDSPNGLTESRPNDSGDHVYVMGKAVTTSGMVMFPQYMGKVA